MAKTLTRIEQREALIQDFISASSQLSYDIPEERVMTPKKTTNSKRLIPRLPSFHAIALIMAFFDYHRGVELLLSRLSKKTKDHHESHKAILRGFVEPWKPQISKSLEYGNVQAIITLPGKYLDSAGK